MPNDEPGTTVTEVALPDRVRDGTQLRRIDYSDAHLVRAPGATQVSAEQWMREMLEHAPAPLRQQLPRGWFLLGLRHGPLGSAGHVLGWPITDVRDDRVVLGARSRLGMPAELVLARTDGGWVFATLIEHDNPAMSLLWRALAEPHRRVVRHLLRSAAAREPQGVDGGSIRGEP